MVSCVPMIDNSGCTMMERILLNVMYLSEMELNIHVLYQQVLDERFLLVDGLLTNFDSRAYSMIDSNFDRTMTN